MNNSGFSLYVHIIWSPKVMDKDGCLYERIQENV